MNIGYNCAQVNPEYFGGVNTYVFGLLKGLISVAKNERIQIYVNRQNSHIFSQFNTYPHVEIVVLPMSVSNIKFRLKLSSLLAFFQINWLHRWVTDWLFASWIDIMNEHSDVIYTPTTVLFPYKLKKPSLLSMHDIQQFTYPHFFSLRELLQRKTRFLLSAELASHFQASSTFIKNDLIKNFKFLRPNQISVIPEGVDVEEFSVKSDINISEKYALPNRFLYFPAQLWSHKNHITVFKALDFLNRSKNIKIPLVLTGASYSESNEIFSFIEKHPELEIFYLGKVPFKEIVALYQQARFFITAVLYESSSLPFLEAAASGCPVIASKTPPNEEMCQILSAQLFDPLDHVGLASLLERVWDDDNLISYQVHHNKTSINYYHWNNIALQYLEVFYRMRSGDFH